MNIPKITDLLFCFLTNGGRMTLLAAIAAFDSIIVLLLVALCEPYFIKRQKRRIDKNVEELYKVKPE